MNHKHGLVTMTNHTVHFQNAQSMSQLPAGSIDLIITSPSYPMIEMWDDSFSSLSSKIKSALASNRGRVAFELMHLELDKVWSECFRVLSNGGILCINIGDAARNIGGNFELYSSHSRVLNYCLQLGLQNLPNIIWRKPTNSPTKFMGSGMYPPGAYVTLEHEYILIFRKGRMRQFQSKAKKDLRKESAFFWEERNCWFSDIWADLKGTGQRLKHKQLRKRSGAFPFDLAYRLINMFSIKDDTVLDPFLGTGTTMMACIAARRNSVGFELDRNFQLTIEDQLKNLVPYANSIISQRLLKHIDFIQAELLNGRKFRYYCANYDFPCVSKQEIDILINNVTKLIQIEPHAYMAEYDQEPQAEFSRIEDFGLLKELIKERSLALEQSKSIKQTSLFKK